MTHHFQLVFLFFLKCFSFFENKSDVDAFRVRHKEQSIVTSHTRCHPKTAEID